MTFADLLELTILHEAEAWFPGCGEDATWRFISYLSDLQRFDRATFDRAIRDITNEIHQHEEGELAA